ncbi:hypothetical protein [Campylobacter concisus]
MQRVCKAVPNILQEFLVGIFDMAKFKVSLFQIPSSSITFVNLF